MAAKQPAVTGPDRGTKLTLAFPGGLVNVPVALKPLAESARPVPGKTMCPVHGPTCNVPEFVDCGRGTAQEHQVPKHEVQTGYPHPDDKSRFVVVDPLVVKSLKEPKSATAEVEQVVDVDTIDPGYLSKAFVVWPQPGGEQPFDLLATVLREDGKAAVVTTVLSQQTSTLVLRWSEHFGVVLAHVVQYESRLRHKDVELVQLAAAQRPEPAAAMLEVARTLFEQAAGTFDADEVRDELTERMQDAIRAAADGVEYVAPEQPLAAAPAGDLMAQLVASQVAAAKKPAPRKAKEPAAKRAPRRKAAA
jgi:DNA end-binding protein Ku